MALIRSRLLRQFVNLPCTRSTGQIRNISFESYFVTPKDLSAALTENDSTKVSNAPRVIPLCAAWFLPNDYDGRTGQTSFLATRIPTAKFFDIEAVIDHNSPYPHMLPTPEVFANTMQNLRIRRDDTLVVYDTHSRGIMSAPRVAWTLKVFGHPNVHILNNFRVWILEKYPTESGEITPESQDPSNYPVPTINTEKVATFEDVKQIAKDFGKEGGNEVQILDARPTSRFDGVSPEPRPGLPSGHIPGSINLPFYRMLYKNNRAFKSKPELRDFFEFKCGLDPQKPIITSCGTGVTAAVLDAALEEAGFGSSNRRLYDGSWTFVQPLKENLA